MRFNFFGHSFALGGRLGVAMIWRPVAAAVFAASLLATTVYAAPPLQAVPGEKAKQSVHSTLTVDDDAPIIPRYLLHDPKGRAVSHDEFGGRFQLISFGYTYCPDICPTTLMEMSEVLTQLGSEETHVQAIFISVDPERDTGEVLATYSKFFHPHILALTGSPQLIRRAADNFHVRYAKVATDQDPQHYAVDHSAGMYLIGPDGRYLRKFTYSTPTDKISATLKEEIDRYRKQLRRAPTS